MEKNLNLDTINKLFLNRVTDHSDEVIYTHKYKGKWVDVTWWQYGEKTCRIASALMALGFRKGEKAICLSKNRWEWYYFAMGVVMAGGAVVGIYPTTPPRQCKYIIDHSEARFILLEDQEQLDKILFLWDGLPILEKVVIIEKFDPSSDHPGLIRMATFEELGRTYFRDYGDDYEQRALEVGPEDILTLVYTSGTTGPPKAAMISHQQVLRVAALSVPPRESQSQQKCLEFLPLAHIGGQVVGHYFRIYSGVPAIIGEGYQQAIYNAWEVEPTTFTSTPRMFEKFYLNIQSRVDDAGKFQQWVFRRAMAVGADVLRFRQEKKTLPLRLKAAHFFADFFVLKKLRELLGGRITYLISGGAPLSIKIVEFFHIIGLPILEAYGMTETTAWVSISKADAFRIGSVGKPIPGIEIKIADDGEILVRSPGNCYGYFKDDQATRNLIDDQGWLHTGDVGRFDDEGFLYITDRKKDIFITAGGKNVAPGNIENLIKTSRFINQAVVYGDQKKYLVALITLDEEEVTKYARDNRIIYKDTKELSQHPEVYHLIRREIERKNKELSSVETIKNFWILPEELEEDRGEVTATQKVRRSMVNKRYKKEMEALYS